MLVYAQSNLLLYQATNSTESAFRHTLNSSDEFELKFPELSQAELKGSQAESSRAGAFQFSS